MSNWDDILAVLDDSPFEEIPVDLDTFVSDPEYLGSRKMKLSAIQRECVLNMTQIYRKETLESFLTPEAAQQRWGQTKNEVILMLGKGSGKDEMSAMAIAYIVYQLLCLKDPAAYYGKPSLDNIDILNIAVNADQASRVFFKKFVNYIKTSPWFQGKYDAGLSGDPARQNEVSFQKNINVYSGHSQREAFEGYNLFAVVLDEIAAFALESAQGEVGKTAEGIYKMYRASVNSRFATFGKYISLSFPRYKGDYIMQLYDRVVPEGGKQVVKRKEVMKIDPELPDGIDGNEISIEWDEDHIDYYTAPKVYALRRPCWDVNPTVTLEEKVSEFVNDYADALGRLACMPPEAVDGFFKDRERVEAAFSQVNGWNHEEDRYRHDFRPEPDTLYFIHVDLAQKHDRAAVALAHVDRWISEQIPGKSEIKPVVKVDLLRYWIPTKQKEVDFQEIQDFIIDLSKKEFDLKLVTFDQWRSEDMRKYLNAIGIRTDLLSVKKEQYVDFAVVVQNRRLEGPDEKMIHDELMGLRLFPNGKIDHPRQGYKDLSDATCGAIFNALTKTPRNNNREIEVRTATDYRKAARSPVPEDVIVAPSTKERVPLEIQRYLDSIKMI